MGNKFTNAESGDTVYICKKIVGLRAGEIDKNNTILLFDDRSCLEVKEPVEEALRYLAAPAGFRKPTPSEKEMFGAAPILTLHENPLKNWKSIKETVVRDFCGRDFVIEIAFKKIGEIAAMTIEQLSYIAGRSDALFIEQKMGEQGISLRDPSFDMLYPEIIGTKAERIPLKSVELYIQLDEKWGDTERAERWKKYKEVVYGK